VMRRRTSSAKRRSARSCGVSSANAVGIREGGATAIASAPCGRCARGPARTGNRARIEIRRKSVIERGSDRTNARGGSVRAKRGKGTCCISGRARDPSANPLGRRAMGRHGSAKRHRLAARAKRSGRPPESGIGSVGRLARYVATMSRTILTSGRTDTRRRRTGREGRRRCPARGRSRARGSMSSN
jgi:hypothetical protein